MWCGVEPNLGVQATKKFLGTGRCQTLVQEINVKEQIKDIIIGATVYIPIYILQ